VNNDHFLRGEIPKKNHFLFSPAAVKTSTRYSKFSNFAGHFGRFRCNYLPKLADSTDLSPIPLFGNAKKSDAIVADCDEAWS